MAKKEEKMELTLEEMQAQMMAMLNEAKAEAAKIVADAKKSADEIMAASGVEKAKKAEEAAAMNAYMEELVEVKLFKDNGKYKDDVYVGVNGDNCVIKRGERVKVKRKFAEVLDNSDRQDYETSKLIEAKSAEFEKSGL